MTADFEKMARIQERVGAEIRPNVESASLKGRVEAEQMKFAISRQYLLDIAWGYTYSRHKGAQP